MKKHLIMIGLGLLLTLSVFAEPIRVQINQTLPSAVAKLGVGSSINLKLPGQPTHTGVFLGKMMNPNGSLNQYMVVDQDINRVFMINASNIDLPKTSMQAILRQYDQIDGTCTGYAMDHLMQQMFWSGFKGNGALKETLSQEKGRTQLLVESINQYYLATQHRFSIDAILNGFGKRFGFKCAKKIFQDSASAIQHVQTQVRSGIPVLVSFNIGPNMVSSNYTIQDYENPAPLLDRRLWVPRKVGERNSGGHSVVAVAAFVVNNRQKLLMLDSDWAYPRIWDVNEYLGGRAKISEVEFVSCK